MTATKENPYHLFSQEIWSNWKKQEVSYVTIEELTETNGVTFFEIIPDADLLDGDDDTFYTLDSDEVLDMLEENTKVKFVVHDIYLED